MMTTGLETFTPPATTEDALRAVSSIATFNYGFGGKNVPFIANITSQFRSAAGGPEVTSVVYEHRPGEPVSDSLQVYWHETGRPAGRLRSDIRPLVPLNREVISVQFVHCQTLQAAEYPTSTPPEAAPMKGFTELSPKAKTLLVDAAGVLAKATHVIREGSAHPVRVLSFPLTRKAS